MAETTSRDETTFDAKRKPDPCCEAKEECPNKIQKLEVVDSDSLHDVKSTENGDHNQNAEVKDDEFEAVVDEEADDEEEEENNYEDDDDEEENDSDDGEKSSEKAAGDRKGKGIMKDDKGKGKLIEEDDDEDDSSDSDLDSDDSDLSDDPLAEVDLDNILPSRTRRRAVQPGVYIAKDLGNVDDDSNDSDA